ncbi:MAG: hypothetical protein FWG81_00120 [Betaproteobacteria bacterium]|nr:hypothetical protein [Betaproteobacteria bacterium]
MPFLRFVITKVNPDSEVEDGLFNTAYALRKASMPEQVRLELEEHLTWFNKNLAVPRRFNRSKSKGYFHRRKTKGISWFRDTAVDHVARMHRLKRIVESNGYHVSIIREDRVGYIVYEDEYQVVAEPFADTKTSS